MSHRYMTFIKKHLLGTLFILGILLRLSLFFIDFSFDVNNHMVWAQDAIRFGLRGFYEKPSSEMFAYKYPNYPPLAIFLFLLIPPLYGMIHNIAWFLNTTIPVFPSKLIFFIESRAFQAGLFKLPGFFADIGIAWIVFLCVKKIAPKNKKIQLFAPSFILFHPTFFYNSSFWGQIDAIPIFLVMVALYALLYRRKIIISALLFTLSLLVKPTSLVFLPVYGLAFLKKEGVQKTILSGFAALFIFWISFIPFYKTGNIFIFPFITYLHKILETQSLSAVSNAAYSAWAIVPKLMYTQDSTMLFAGLSYRIVGYIIAGIVIASIIKIIWEMKINTHTMMYGLALSAFAFVLFMTRTHERYLILPLVSLLLVGIKDKVAMRLWIVASTISFLNLYKSFAVPKIPSMVEILNAPIIIFIFSLTNSILFFILLKHLFNQLKIR